MENGKNTACSFSRTQTFLESSRKPRHLLGINQLDWLFLNADRGHSSVFVFDHSLSKQVGRERKADA
jgi:hypothetical protein